MMDGYGIDRDRSFVLAERAHGLMRDHGPSATPRAYAVWFTYASGTKPLLNEAIQSLTAGARTLSDKDLSLLYETYVAPNDLAAGAERTSTGMLSQIEGIIEVVNHSLGSTAQYGESLRAIANALDGSAPTPSHIHEIVAALVGTTREVIADYQALETRMRESHREIETLREALEATRIESLTDPLTGLFNRKHFEDSLTKMVAASTATGTAASLIVIDVDSFKRFNDVYGHLTGDQVLRLVAKVMRDHIADKGILARFGGEEFGILLPGIGRTSAFALAEKIRTSVMGRDLVKRSTGESLGKVTISLGVARIRPDDTTTSFLERADQCMFKAKRDGKNRTVDDAPQDVALSDVA